MNKYLVIFLALGLLFVGCTTDDVDPVPNPNLNPNREANLGVQDFMWKTMNRYYFWQDNVTELGDTAFTNDETYTDFLATEADPSDFFNSLKFSEDRFSRANDDYRTYVQQLGGLSNDNGLKFGLAVVPDSDDVYGYVRYILPNSDAASKDIARGDLFTGVNGTTLNRANFGDLLFGDASTYTLNMATISNNELSPNGEEVTLTKQAEFQEDPIHIEKIFERDGIKIGYLLYNRFFNEFDEQLNAVFGRFKDAGVTELVLDLRYNPGGSVLTASSLASMIHSTDTEKLLSRQLYSPKAQAFFEPIFGASKNFRDKTGSGSAINTLNLSKVYIIALLSSASASELVINTLDPYMEVAHIGATTRGKNEFSTTYVDDVENQFFYSPARENQIKEGNSWAIQPLIGRTENSDGFSDYTAGLVPDILIEETLDNLGVLGDENERLLARALAEISSSTSKFDFNAQMPFEVFEDSEMMAPFKNNAIVEYPVDMTLQKK